MIALAPIFLKPELFQMKFLDVFSVAVSLSIYNWVRVASAVKIAKESVAIQTGCGKDAYKIEGTS